MGIITYILKKVLLISLALFCLVLLFSNTELVKKAVNDTLIMCFFKLIPSIFPFMVISSFFIQSGAMDKIFDTKHKSIFGICKNAFSIVFASWISGYIAGPRYLCEKETDADMTNYIFLASNAGLGFVVSYVGLTLWNNIYFGIFLYAIQIISAIFIFKINANNEEFNFKRKQAPLFTAISSSIQQSTHTMLEICGFTTIFSVIKGLTVSILHLENNNILPSMVSSSLEITGGALAAVNMSSVNMCAFFTGFTVGFGGLCMCFQTFSVTIKSKVNKGSFIVKKIVQGIICGLSSVLFVLLLKIEPIKTAFANLQSSFNYLSVTSIAIFIFCLIYTLKKWIKRKI